MNLETKITIYKFTPQVFTLTQFTPTFQRFLPGNRSARLSCSRQGCISTRQAPSLRRPGTGQTYSRDWNLVASGTRITAEFGAFLKALLRQSCG